MQQPCTYAWPTLVHLVLGHHDVVGLQVLVHDAPRVAVGHRLQDGPADMPCHAGSRGEESEWYRQAGYALHGTSTTQAALS